MPSFVAFSNTQVKCRVPPPPCLSAAFLRFPAELLLACWKSCRNRALWQMGRADKRGENKTTGNRPTVLTAAGPRRSHAATAFPAGEAASGLARPFGARGRVSSACGTGPELRCLEGEVVGRGTRAVHRQARCGPRYSGESRLEGHMLGSCLLALRLQAEERCRFCWCGGWLWWSAEGP